MCYVFGEFRCVKFRADTVVELFVGEKATKLFLVNCAFMTDRSAEVLLKAGKNHFYKNICLGFAI